VKDDRVFLRHILESLDAIRAYIAGSRDTFFTDRKTRKATMRELQELAESTQRLSPSLRTRHPEIPWGDISGFRNVLVHDYLGITLSRIWDVVQRDLPALRSAVHAMLHEVGAEDRGA
jgi:uncharacterized protein with HEPN domain